MITKGYLTDLTYKVNGAAIEVHKRLGPGLLEKFYQSCLEVELELRGIKFESEKLMDFEYKGRIINSTLRCDLLVESILVVELKSVDKILPILDAQVLSYMKILNSPKGILYNFNVFHLYDEGQKTFVNESYRYFPEK